MRNVGFVLLGLVFATLAFGQASDGNLVGIVSDASGAAVTNANVEVRNLATGVAVVSKTSEAGEYRFNNLPVGQYDLSATAPGFATAKLSHLIIELNKTVTANLSLQVST